MVTERNPDHTGSRRVLKETTYNSYEKQIVLPPPADGRREAGTYPPQLEIGLTLLNTLQDTVNKTGQCK